MHSLVANLIAAGSSATTTAGKSKSSSSSLVFFVFIIVIFGAVYLLMIRPRQQKMRQQQTAARQLTIGDPVLTIGGIQGRLVGLDGDEAEVEVSPGVVMTFIRRAVNPHPNPPAFAPPDAQEEWVADADGAAPDPETAAPGATGVGEAVPGAPTSDGGTAPEGSGGGISTTAAGGTTPAEPGANPPGETPGGQT